MKLPAFIHRSITSLIKAVATNKLASDQLPLAPTGSCSTSHFPKPCYSTCLVRPPHHRTLSFQPLKTPNFFFFTFGHFSSPPSFWTLDLFSPCSPLDNTSLEEESLGLAPGGFTLFTRCIVSPTTVSKASITSYSSQTRETKSKHC